MGGGVGGVGGGDHFSFFVWENGWLKDFKTKWKVPPLPPLKMFFSNSTGGVEMGKNILRGGGVGIFHLGLKSFNHFSHTKKGKNGWKIKKNQTTLQLLHPHHPPYFFPISPPLLLCSPILHLSPGPHENSKKNSKNSKFFRKFRKFSPPFFFVYGLGKLSGGGS